MDPRSLSAARTALRDRAPLVHCLTNTVVRTFTANALLAVGAAPAMVDAPEEAGDCAAVASGVLVNVGTVHQRTAQAMRVAARSAGAAGTPRVRRPGGRGQPGLPHRSRRGAGRAAPRRRPRQRLRSPGTGRCRVRRAGCGLDGHRGRRARGAAVELGVYTHPVVVVSGEVDLITDDRLAGAVAAHAHVALAAEVAAAAADGPGTFAAAWLDALDAVTADRLAGADVRSRP